MMLIRSVPSTERQLDGVFQRYDATCFDNLSSSYYGEVFGDLELMINDN